MIRIIALQILWVLTCLSAFSETHYFLIDNSGSMSPHRDSAEQEISAAIQTLPENRDVSITYFRGVSNVDCQREVIIRTPTNVSQNTTFGADEIADGSTLLVGAINALHSAVPDGENVLVTVFTDGGLRGESCDTPDEVCSAVAALKTQRPEIRLQLRAPITIKELGVLLY